MAHSYLLYCDESGQRNYGPKTDPYFVVAGVLASADEVPHLEDEIRGLKRAFWGAPEIEIKSNWIRQPKERQKHYVDKHGVDLPEINELMTALLKWMRKAPLTLLAGVVDKPQMESKYAQPHYAGAVAYTLTLQRYQKYLNKAKSTGSVIFDDPSGKSPGGHDWRVLLQRQHLRLRKHGCPYTGLQFDALGALSFSDSASSVLVQVADLVAYNTFRQFRDHGKQYDEPGIKRLSLYQHFANMLPMFDQGPNRVFAGYGVAKWPLRSKHGWVVPK